MAIIACTILSSYSLPGSSTENFSADIGLLSGPNQVEVLLYRDIGDGCVTFKVDIWFNSESNVHTFNFSMDHQQLQKSDIVQGTPSPVGFAGISQQPYDIQYNCGH